MSTKRSLLGDAYAGAHHIGLLPLRAPVTAYQRWRRGGRHSPPQAVAAATGRHAQHMRLADEFRGVIMFPGGREHREDGDF